MHAGSNQKDTAWVIFNRVRRTPASNAIDMFLDGETGHSSANYPTFVGRFSRTDMGHCIRHGVSRALNATPAVAALGLISGYNPGIAIRVRHLHEERDLTAAEYAYLPGFTPVFRWGDLRNAPITRDTPATCCNK